jgi:hypothetical protein
MPSISAERKQYYKSRIRSVVAQHPQITQVALRERLAAEGLSLDRGYVADLLKSIHVERIKRLNTLTLNYALSAFQDTMMEISAVAWSIAIPSQHQAAEVRSTPQRRWQTTKASYMPL